MSHFRFGWPEVLFSVKCFAAAMLAYYISLRIGLTRPYWAVTTSYIVAQPLAGAALSKAAFRVIGTIVGASMAVVLVPNLVNAPELLSLALALWLGICLYIALLDRTPRAYVFLLAGYTASIIGIPSVTAPMEIFSTAVLRVQEITLGILCSSLLHGLVFPRTVTDSLLARIDSILADAERWSRDALTMAGDPVLDRDRRRLALDISELHQISVHLPFDTARFRPRVRTLRALQDELSMVLPLASAVDDRVSELGRDGEALPATMMALIEDVQSWLASPPSLEEGGPSADVLIARARALEPDMGTSPPDWKSALQLSMLARLADLIAAHRNCRDLRDQMRAPTHRPLNRGVAELLARKSDRVVHLDRGIALRTAAGAVATVLIGCALWIATAWPEGGGAVLIAGIFCALFGNLDNPAPVIVTVFWGSLIAFIVAAFYAFAILPRVTDFVTLVLVLAPIFLLIGMMMAKPPLTLLAMGLVLTFPNTVGLNDRYGGNFDVFLNGAIAQLAGTLFAVTTVRLFQVVGARSSARRLLRAGWRDIARRANAPGRPEVSRWIGRMLDRIGLLGPRLAAAGALDPGKPLLDALTDLRVGVALGELRVIRLDGTPADSALISPVLSGVGRHYADVRVDRPHPPASDLLAGIDRALSGLALSPVPETRRQGVLALTSLRRNLFPAAAPYRAIAA